jgi:hypothetical protein
MNGERVQALHEAIKQHLQIHGPRDWRLVRDIFPDFSNATFWRYVKAARAPITSPEVNSGPPSPSGPDRNAFWQSFSPREKLAAYERLISEAEEMGRQAKNGQGRITNWRMYAKSVEMRRTFLAGQVELLSPLFNTKEIERVFDDIFKAVESISPDKSKEIFGRIYDEYLKRTDRR